MTCWTRALNSWPATPHRGARWSYLSPWSGNDGIRTPAPRPRRLPGRPGRRVRRSRSAAPGAVRGGARRQLDRIVAERRAGGRHRLDLHDPAGRHDADAGRRLRARRVRRRARWGSTTPRRSWISPPARSSRVVPAGRRLVRHRIGHRGRFDRLRGESGPQHRDPDQLPDRRHGERGRRRVPAGRGRHPRQGLRPEREPGRTTTLPAPAGSPSSTRSPTPRPSGSIRFRCRCPAIRSSPWSAGTDGST